MTTETKQPGMYWLDQYAKKKDTEDASFQYCVIDGQKYGVSPSGRSYCAGPVKQGVVTPPQPIQRKPVVKKKAVTSIKKRGTTDRNVTAKTVFKLRSDGLTTRAKARQINLSAMTVTRILHGQRKLM